MKLKYYLTLFTLFISSFVLAEISFTIMASNGVKENWSLLNGYAIRNNEITLSNVTDMGIITATDTPAVYANVLALTTDGLLLTWDIDRWVNYADVTIPIAKLIKNGTRVISWEYGPYWYYTNIGWVFGTPYLQGWVFVSEENKWAYFID